MRLKKITVLVMAVLLHSGLLYAGERTPSQMWDAFLDVGYRFTILPDEDLASILESEGKKYGQSLAEYTTSWEEKLGGPVGGRSEGTMPYPDSVYRRVAVAHLLLFLSGEGKEHLDTALLEMGELASRRDTPRIVFWNNLVLAHDSLRRRDSLSFSHHVFRIWNDVIQVVETGQILAGTDLGATGFVKGLPYLYENVVHLVLYHGIVRHKMPRLHSLGAVILSMRERLVPGKGYHQLVESVWNRMHGLVSDNYSINFAMAFLEGEVRWIGFEGAKSPEEAAEAYRQALVYYGLALDWADTGKGKAAALSRLMQSMIRTLNDIVRGSETTSHPAFTDVPVISRKYVVQTRELYSRMSKSERWMEEGFENRENYVKAMHDLWTNFAQLDIMLARYHKHVAGGVAGLIKDDSAFKAVSGPLLDYLDFFEDFIAGGYRDIVPDNAYFYAAYMAGELAGLHRAKAPYSRDMRDYDLAFTRQLQAVEIYPFDITGILTMGTEASQEGTLKEYMDNVKSLADRLGTSKVAATWAANKDLPFSDEIASLRTVIPEVLKSAPAVIGLPAGRKGGKELIRDTLIFTQLQKVILQSDFADKGDTLLAEIAGEYREGKDLKKVIKTNLPPDVYSRLESVIALIEKCRYSQLKKELFRNPEDVYHKLIRSIYHEVPRSRLRYLRLLESLTGGKEGKREAAAPFSLPLKAADEARVL